jgi:hypothetical protein
MTTITTDARKWRLIDGSRRRLFSQIGLRLIDELTSKGPLGQVRSRLSISDGLGGWIATEIRPIKTASGILAYPELEGPKAQVAGQPARRYRVQIEAQFYRPIYRTTADGIEFDIFPWNDENSPQTVNPNQPIDVKLAPATNYPFPSHVPVVRGVVLDAGKPVGDVEVIGSNVERVVTDERGSFSLPIRSKPNNVPFPIDAIDHRTTKTGNTPVTLPDDLGKNKTINIS